MATLGVSFNKLNHVLCDKFRYGELSVCSVYTIVFLGWTFVSEESHAQTGIKY